MTHAYHSFKYGLILDINGYNFPRWPFSLVGNKSWIRGILKRKLLIVALCETSEGKTASRVLWTCCDLLKETLKLDMLFGV